MYEGYIDKLQHYESINDHIMVHILRDQLYRRFIKDITYKKFKRLAEVQEAARIIRIYAIDVSN